VAVGLRTYLDSVRARHATHSCHDTSLAWDVPQNYRDSPNHNYMPLINVLAVDSVVVLPSWSSSFLLLLVHFQDTERWIRKSRRNGLQAQRSLVVHERETRRIAMTIPRINRLPTQALCALALPVAPLLPRDKDATPQGTACGGLSSLVSPSPHATR